MSASTEEGQFVRIPSDTRASTAGSVEVPLRAVQGTLISDRADYLTIEEPLEIRLHFSWDGVSTERTISVTMRTPGNDFELAVGFLLTEGVLAHPGDLAEIRHCGRSTVGRENVVRVRLCPRVLVDLQRLERYFYTSSSCGVCGKTSIAAVQLAQRYRLAPGPVLDPRVIHRLPDTLRSAQSAFLRTGGLHAAALFDPCGSLIAVREDVGRHNALDKLIGSRFLTGDVPLSGRVLLVSGRVSFELVQKATIAGIAVLAAVGAPSSLAVELARSRGMTLLGFVRDGRFNVYSGAERVRAAAPTDSSAGVADVQPPPVPAVGTAPAPAAAV